MNKTLTLATVLALAMATIGAAPALARDDRGRHGYGHRDHDRHAHRHDRRDDARHRDRRHDRYDRRPVVVRHVYQPPHHSGPPRWARGGHVHGYDRSVYVVHDYRGYGLRHPPRGHRWMRDDHGDYLLVAIATGVIVDLILRH